MGWTDPARVVRYLGSGVDVADPYLGDVVGAANAWAVRKRAEAGYTDDDPDVAPSEDVAQGTTMYAGALYRERASADSFASFEEISGFAATGTMGQIRRLLGIGRARVDQAPTVEQLVAARRQRRLRGVVW